MCEVPQRLLDIYIPLRTELQQGIRKLKADSLVFNKQFEERGPMVEGLTPTEAIERLVFNRLPLVFVICLF